jgi:putative transposase
MTENLSHDSARARPANRLGAPQDHKVKALLAIEQMIDEGKTVRDAVAEVAKDSGIGVRTLFTYRKKTDFVPRSEWASVLSPKWNPSIGIAAQCHPAALERFIELCKRPVSIKECYRQTCAEAIQKGWKPVPSERTLRRAMDHRGGLNKDQKRALKRDAQPSSEAAP